MTCCKEMESDCESGGEGVERDGEGVRRSLGDTGESGDEGREDRGGNDLENHKIYTLYCFHSPDIQYSHRGVGRNWHDHYKSSVL